WRGIGDIASAAHVPFAEMASGVAGSLERARDGGGFWIEEVRLFRAAIAGAGLEEIGDAPARGVHPGEKTGARRRADGRGDVELSELGSFSGETVDVRRGNEVAAVAADVAVAHVVGEEEEDVGFGGGFGGVGARGEQD